MAEGDDWETWASIIRSICRTSKTPLAMNEIARDFKMMEGEDLPYRRFNFRSLEEMIRNIPDMKIFNLGGKIVAQAAITQETAHITSLVKRAKSSKKKKRTIAPKVNRYNMSSRRPNHFNFDSNRSNNYMPNRPTGYSSQSSYTKSPKVVTFAPTPPPSPKPTISSASCSTSTTPVQQRIPQGQKDQSPQQKMSTQQQRFSPTVSAQTQQARPSPGGFTSPPKITIAPQSTTPLQQRLAANVQQRLNVQKPHTTPHPMHDPRLILNSYVEARKLPLPVYKDVPSKDKNIYSSVTVNSKKYSSYPNEAKTKEDAEKLAAQAALAELLDKSNIPETVTTNRVQIMQRILDIVNSHPNGLFESSLVANYVAKHKEGLPSNWLKMVEHAINIDIGANNLTILSPQQDSGAQQLSRPTSPSINEPPALNLSNLDEFWFRVYVVYSTADVWGVINSESNSDEINDLAIDMKHFYDINAAIPNAIVPGQYYAVLDSEWHRVRCIKVDSDAKTATVFFIDRGDEDVFEFANLRDLATKFYKLPAQAIQISLYGLESFCDCPEMYELLEEALIEKDVWVAVNSANKQIGAPLLAQCYIQKEEEERTVDINLELVQKFMSEFADPKVFMKADKPVCEVYVSEIRNKEIYVQVKSIGLKMLNDILTDLANNYLDVRPVTPATRLEKSKLYLVKTDAKWKRIKVLREINDKAQVECIDEGSIIEVQKDNLVSIEDHSNILALFPRQAIQVNLHKISPIMFDDKMAAHLRSHAPKDDVFHMKVHGDRELIARVELYKRTENNLLASLNDTLVLEPEISSKTDDNNNDKTKLRLRNNRKSLNARMEFPLKTPEIPPINEYFDIVVTMAAHPGNFTVQPLKNANELKKLMFDLSVACSAYNGPLLTSSNVKIGNMYAAKYDNDGKWYRAYVSKILGKNICAVYFCDYGDYRAVSLEQLQPLANQFYDLPYQAIKAKLHGITPKLKGDWTVKDSLRFNDLVVDKSFVSIVKAYDVDNTAGGETILSLELIDTSTEDDVYIIQQLVEEKRAERIEA